MKDLSGDKSDFFLRTLAEYVSSEGLVYCFVHNRHGHSIISFAPHELASKIPHDIQKSSLFTRGLIKNAYTLSETGNTYYEFAKPVFEGGERSGTIRLGLKLPSTSLLSLEKIGLLAMVAFLLFATVIFVYYGMTLALKPLRKLYTNLDGTWTGQTPTVISSEEKGGMLDIIQDLEQSFFQLRETLQKTKEDNVEITARLGVSNFEKNQISRIIDSLNSGIVITDIQENINHINSFILKRLNMERSDAVSHSLSDILKHDEITSFISQQGSLKSSSNGNYIEAMFPDPSAGEVFRISSTYMRDNEGSIIGKIISFKDITREKSSEKSKHQFIANVAHEFLTPLTTIRSYNEMLMDGEIEEKEMQKELYNTIGEEIARLSRLIHNLLNLSKIEMGSLRLSKGLVKTDWLVEDTITAVETAAKKKNIVINKKLPDQIPSIMGDKELLKTAIINILGNAVKYSPEGRDITFSLREHENIFVFDISDTGYGISDEDLPHIFDRFYRSKNPDIVRQTGSGLGLAMTSEIVHLHGGEIGVQSKPGEGTQFKISIPKEEYYLAKH